MPDAWVTPLRPRALSGYTDTAALNDIHVLLTADDPGDGALADIAGILARTGRAMIRPHVMSRQHDRSQLTCGRCSRPVRTGVRRWPEGHICPGCFVSAMETYATCHSCGHHRLTPGLTSDGHPICPPCAGQERGAVVGAG